MASRVAEVCEADLVDARELLFGLDEGHWLSI
jgi:hypothetical protein